jgi:hypothetical protein
VSLCATAQCWTTGLQGLLQHSRVKKTALFSLFAQAIEIVRHRFHEGARAAPIRAPVTVPDTLRLQDLVGKLPVRREPAGDGAPALPRDLTYTLAVRAQSYP